MIKLIWRTLLILAAAGLICAGLYLYNGTMQGNPLGAVTQQLRLTIVRRPGHDDGNAAGGQQGNNLGDPGRNGGGRGNSSGDPGRTGANNAVPQGNMLLSFGVTINNLIQILLVTLVAVAIQWIMHKLSLIHRREILSAQE